MGTTFNAGQLAELSRHVNVAVATALPAVADRLDPKKALNALSRRTEVLASYLETGIEQAIKSMMALIPHPQRSVTISERRDPDTYFQTRAGLWVDPSFRKLVVSKAKAVDAGATFRVNEDELGEFLSDAQIEAGLSKAHCFAESAVCTIVPELIESRKLDKSNWYLLYLDSCVVHVLWIGGNREWRVIAWPRDDLGWDAGNRVLSPDN